MDLLPACSFTQRPPIDDDWQLQSKMNSATAIIRRYSPLQWFVEFRFLRSSPYASPYRPSPPRLIPIPLRLDHKRRRHNLRLSMRDIYTCGRCVNTRPDAKKQGIILAYCSGGRVGVTSTSEQWTTLRRVATTRGCTQQQRSQRCTNVLAYHFDMVSSPSPNHLPSFGKVLTGMATWGTSVGQWAGCLRPLTAGEA